MTTPAPHPGGPYPPGPPYPPYPQPTQENGMAIASLVLGILGVCCVAPFVGSILAIVFGKIGMNKADQGLANNKSMAQWGFWLGIVGLVLNVLGAIGWIALIAIDSAN